MKKNRFLYLLIICLGVIINVYACNSPNKKTAIHKGEADTITYVTDSISPHGERIKKYGNDSIYAFYEDGNLSSIEYLDSTIVIDRIKFREGYKVWIRYKNSENALFIEHFYPVSGKLSSRIYMKDTIIFTDGNPIQCNELIIDYHENGKVEYIGYQGSFIGQGIPVGVCSYYDSLGYLTKTKNYIYPKQKDEDNIFTYVIESEYYKNGKPKWEKIYNNYVFYESGEEDKELLGTWKYYDENGTLIKIEKYKDGELVKTKEY